MKVRSANAGFTLVEMLIAMAIVVTIVSLVYGSYFATAGSTEVCTAKIDAESDVQNALKQMSRQIRCAYASQAQQPSGDSSSVFKPMQATLDKTINYFYGDTDTPTDMVLNFVTTHPVQEEHGKTKGLFIVRYKLNKTFGTLLLNEERFTGLPERTSENKLRALQPVLTNVDDIDLAFYDGKKWLTKWNYEKEKSLPCAVRISITVSDKENRLRHNSITAYIHCSSYKSTTNKAEKLL
jgi:type II secretion system protein J